jgi:DNA-binding transcriptional LysR family regulator
MVAIEITYTIEAMVKRLKNTLQDLPPGPVADAGGLRAFVAVARSGTVGAAAALLNRTQPSISARLAALERGWGTRLFRRTARGMALTPEGARLLPAAEASLRSLEELDREAGLPLAAKRELRVGAGDALGRELLPKALARLLELHPGIEVYLREGPAPRLVEALRDGEIDLAFVVQGGVDREEGIDLQPCISSKIDVLAPPGRLRSRAQAVPLTAMAKERLVVLQPGSGFRTHLESAFSAAGLQFHPAVEVGNLSLVRRFVAAGLGVAAVPAVAFAVGENDPWLDRRRLNSIPPVNYQRAIRAGVPLPALVRDFLDLLRP